MNGDDGLEDMNHVGPCSKGLPAAYYALHPNLEKGLFIAIGEGSTIFVACFRHTSDQLFFNQTPRRRPPDITGRHVNSNRTVGWSP